MTHDLAAWTFDELRQLLPGAEHAVDFRLSYAMVDADGRLRTVARLVAVAEGIGDGTREAGSEPAPVAPLQPSAFSLQPSSPAPGAPDA